MCGINGLWDASGLLEEDLQERLRRMTLMLTHRGPDEQDLWREPEIGVGLGHTRLSIIDLSPTGHQPMVGPSGSAVTVFNGEIYNYLELREELMAGGVQFRGTSDTEVLLALYEKYGLDCVNRLRGMFAFAIWDRAERRLVLGRDRLGKKPLYWRLDGQTLYFASEIKAIRVASTANVTMDQEAVDEYLSFGFIAGERTIYKEIRELPPGCLLVATQPTKVAIMRYWEPRWKPKAKLSFTDAANDAEALLTEAIRIRLRSDVPIGVFLSGGIDSGLITAIVTKIAGRCLTVSVGFEDEFFDERPLARQVAQRYETDHHEILLRPDVSSLIPKITRYYDEPFADASAIPSFAVAAYARQHMKVVLTGDGGDELFAGYRRDLAAGFASGLISLVGDAKLAVLSKALLRALPSPHTHRSSYAFFHRFLRGTAVQNTHRMLLWSSDGFTPLERLQLGGRPNGSGEGLRAFDSFMASCGGMRLLERTLAMDLLWILPYDLLVKMDIATMAHGLEARSPFLDHELVEWAALLPNHVRLPGVSTKPILRRLARKYLPDNVRLAPKKGFEVPLYRWLTRDLKEMRDDLLLSRTGLVARMLDCAKVEQLLKGDPRIEPGRWARLVWILLMLAAWDYYVQRDDKAFLPCG